MILVGAVPIVRKTEVDQKVIQIEGVTKRGDQEFKITAGGSSVPEYTRAKIVFSLPFPNQ
jgi:hypothetical protein